MQHSLATLTTLVQEISGAENAMSAMQTIVARLSQLMDVPVCSLYLKSPTRSKLILAATQGLSESSVGKIKLNLNEGLVGVIASTKHPLNLADAQTHDKFVFFPQAQEAPYRKFMGVPLIHLRQLIGVIVVQGTTKDPFSQEAEAFLVTIASQLAATLYNIQRSGEWIPTRRPAKLYKRFNGIVSSSGIGIGDLTHINTHIDLLQVPEKLSGSPKDEQNLFETALQKVSDDLEHGANRIKKDLPEDIVSLFSVYRMMLQSPELRDGTLQEIQLGNSAMWSVRKTALELATVFEMADDPYMKARGEDVRNIAIKLMMQMAKRERSASPDSLTPIILAGDLISIADLSEYSSTQIKGIICSSGSALSHTSIVANALGLPAVMGVADLDIKRYAGQLVVIDGNRGEVVISPPKEMIKEYRQLEKNDQQFNQKLAKYRDLPAVTLDGFHVTLHTNTGLLADVSPGLRNGAEGIGLYRSEIPFMVHDSFPTEEEQYLTYKEVIDAYSPRPVSMRTLDIGGDKQLPYFEFKEENPYLGWRGIRFTLDNTALQVTQIRAMLRAAHGRDNLQILIPMVSRIDEVKAIKDLIQQSLVELNKEGKQVIKPKLGIMIEVPSAMLLLDKIAPYIDFVSIGSNDLTQYLLAVDRNNPKVSRLFDNLNPAVLVALQMIKSKCTELNLSVSLCGEMAADPASVLLLIAMGFDRLSLSAHKIPKIKWIIRQLKREDLLKLLAKANAAEDEAEVRKVLSKKIKELGL
ncbi:phosphoenolpyruvate--protein phosphotransferase [Neptunomonas qingdaonensis]|uniref:phosphoenolpyruvate--protein phosphotransferase n=1 Tax=Neptunomonas qingdaonensis TaxID=1045558 RepID=A0A1I2SP20_9GAMM|nr:phosphoenolpyruvate--protein phosphotransferase [Neptunomonas qingdaonensis]SFG54343.1 phosphotransferase system, enzyme I, PtsI/phosphotransferase system, enzyme I, PtsP [Neptunomonas qingdaonensis]